MVRRGTLLRTTIAVFAITFILIIMHWLGWLRPIESGITFVVQPIGRGLRTVSMRIGNSLRLLGQISSLDQENKRLNDQLIEAQAQIAKLQDGQAELKDLRARQNAKLPSEIKTIAAGVVGHDAISGTKRLTINRGEHDGIKKGQAVLSNDGALIGKINQVYRSTAEVVLITDDISAIPSLISQSRATGITHGELGLGLKITDIPQKETINVGDLVESSGLGGEIPKGLIIGSIESIETAANELFQSAHVRPYVDVTRLEFVHIVIEF